MRQFTVKQICEKIWDLENKYDLLNWEIQEVKPWHLLRMTIYYQITQRVGIFHESSDESKPSRINKLKIYFQIIVYSVLKNPLWGSYRKNILIFEHSRKVFVKGKYIDIYSQYLIDGLKPDEYEIIEEPFLHKHLSKNKHNRKYMEYFQAYTFIQRKLAKIKFSDTETSFISQIESEINRFFDIRLDLKDMIYQGILDFKFRYQFFSKLIKKRKPKQIYVVVAYFKMPLIAAAKANNVPVIEIQHGTMSRYHLGYSFPNQSELDYFPDIFYAFGDYWPEAVKFPVSKDKIINYGFPYLTNRIGEFNDIGKKEKQIIFISQAVIGKDLSKIAYELAVKSKDYHIIFKLHPEEYERWKNEYHELVLASKLQNFEVADNNQKNLYSYFAESEFQIGVFSTAIYEGLAFNCKTILYNLPGIEYMQYLQEKGIVAIVNNLQELGGALISFKPASFNREYFFK